MAFDHDFGTFNIENSINVWLAGKLTTNLPPAVTTMLLVINHPEQSITPPCWSIHHLGSELDPVQYQGAHVDGSYKGYKRFGLAEVNCWVSRRIIYWRKQLQQMRDSVTKSYTEVVGGYVPIYDFYTNEQAPAVLSGYSIRLDSLTSRVAPKDPNPDLERARLVIVYSWIERA